MRFLSFSRNFLAYLFFSQLFFLSQLWPLFYFLKSNLIVYAPETEISQKKHFCSFNRIFAEPDITAPEIFSHGLSLIFTIKTGQPLPYCSEQLPCFFIYFLLVTVFRASVFRVMQNPERNRSNNTAIQLLPDYVFSCISDTSQPDSLPGNICQGPKAVVNSQIVTLRPCHNQVLRQIDRGRWCSPVV